MEVSMADARDDGRGERADLPLSEKEKRILELYDRLLTLEFELALRKASQEATIDMSAQVSPEAVREAQDRLLEARASWMLRNEVVESVMMVNPIIKAVHRGTDASPIERDLLPHIEIRDEASTTVAKKDAERRRLDEEMREVQVKAMQIGRRNSDLAAQVLTLAEAAGQNEAGSIDDPETKDEIARLERELKASRQRWKVMKGTASAVVAGSGVDWVKDAELRDIVLDPD